MPVQDQGVRLSVEGLNQFLSAMQKAQGSVDGFTQKATHADKPTKNLTASSMALATAMGQALYNGAIAAGRAISSFMSSAVAGASDLAETTSKTTVVFGDQADKIFEMGKSAASSMGMTENAALSAAATYGNLFRSMGMAENTSADMSMSLVQLASDLASFNNMDPTEVMDKLRAGLVGESEPLKTLGVNINETIIKEKALELGLYSGTGALDANAKAQAAYALILEQTTLAQGDFARTSEGLANQQRIAGANWENIKTKLGAGILPIVTKLTKAFNLFVESPFFQGVLDKAVVWLDGLSTKLGSLLDQLTGTDPSKFFENLGSMFSGGMGGIFDAFSGDGGGFSEIIGTFITNIVKNAVTNPAKWLKVGLDILNNLAVAIQNAVPTLIPVFITLIESMVQFIVVNLPILIDAGLEIVVTLAEAILNALPTLIQAALKLIPAIVMAVIDTLPKLIDAVVEIIPLVVTTLLDSLPEIIKAGIELIIALVEGIIKAIPDLLAMIPEIVVAIFEAIVESLPIIAEGAVELVWTLIDGIVKLLPTVGKEAGKLIVAVGEGIGKLIPTLLQVGKDIVTGIWNGILAKKTEFTNNIRSFFKGIIDGVKDLLGIDSPSKVFAEIGAQTVGGLNTGFKNTLQMESPSKVFEEAGKMMMAGTERGILESFAGPMKAMNFAAQAMVAAVQPQAPVMISAPAYSPPAPINVNVSATANSPIDYYRLARVVAEELRIRRS